MVSISDMELEEVQSCLVSPSASTKICFVPLSTFDIKQRGRCIQRAAFYEPSYRSHEEIDNLIQHAKKCLADVLVYFYPVAGRLTLSAEDNQLGIDCNNAGVEWHVAAANALLAKIDYSQPCSASYSKLIHGSSGKDQDALLRIQVTKFKCGGVSVAWSYDHSLGDNAAMSHFLSSWSQACLGKEITLLPYHDRGFAKKYEQLALEIPQAAAGCKPQQQAASGNSSRSAATSISAKLFSFSEEAIHRLKQKAGRFSSFQVACAHIWLNFCAASCLPDSQKTRVVVAIDCRKRLVPELAEGYFGNVVLSTAVDSRVGELQAQGLPLAARIIAEGIRAFDMETIQKRLAKGGGIDIDGASIVVGGSHRSLVYEMDVGFGRPVAVRNILMYQRNGLCFFDPSPKGPKSLEVTVFLEPEAMEKFTLLMNQ